MAVVVVVLVREAVEEVPMVVVVAEVPVEEVLVGMVMAVAGVPVMPAFHEHDVTEDDFHQLAQPSHYCYD